MSDPGHVARQRHFYDTREHDHLQARRDDYYAYKVAKQLAVGVGVGREHRVLELGAGFGRFTFPLLEFCGSVMAFDLSERALDSLVRTRDERGIPAERCSVHCADVNDPPGELPGAAFDFVVGFFFLHHLADFAATIRRLVPLVAPGGWMAFVEPNRRNPAFAAQVAVCRDMTWREERGMFSLSGKAVEAAFRSADMRVIQTRSFGLFPPQVLNRFGAARSLEQHLEGLRVLQWILPLLLLSAQTPRRDGTST